MPISEAQKRAQKKYYENNKEKIKQALLKSRKKNSRQISLRLEIYNKLKKLATECGLSMAKFIENLIKEK